MSQVRFFTDEDVYRHVADRLRAQGFDALSTPEAGRLGESDVSQLTWATQESRVLVAFNVGHFAAFHHDWRTQGRRHAGIVVSQQHPIGNLIRRLVALARAVSAEEMVDRLEYLSNWPAS